tara:strand:- start:51 stop:533 length:483 start_codon:yes stop_codon:yes gene_type:complete
MSITIYTDGSAKGNPGKGGFGVVLLSGDHRKELSGGFRLTTNNRMELLAVIVALESVKKQDVKITVFSDSKYVVDAVEKKWVFSWQKRNFKKKKNVDLWIRFLKVFKKNQVSFVWVKGHADIKENERCDFLAVQASENENLATDQWYEENVAGGSPTLFD